MFYECESLEKIDLSSFDISNVEDIAAMFYNCNLLKNIPDWYHKPSLTEKRINFNPIDYAED